MSAEHYADIRPADLIDDAASVMAFLSAMMANPTASELDLQGKAYHGFYLVLNDVAAMLESAAERM